ncbi:hypothetical protein D3C71_1473290 [compost metagenome]
MVNAKSHLIDNLLDLEQFAHVDTGRCDLMPDLGAELLLGANRDKYSLRRDEDMGGMAEISRDLRHVVSDVLSIGSGDIEQPAYTSSKMGSPCRRDGDPAAWSPKVLGHIHRVSHEF